VPVAPVYVAPVYQVPVSPVVPAKPVKPAMVGTPGTVLVKLPADATMFIDGVKADLDSATRQFNTPTLQAGQDYYYTIRVEALRNGELVTQSQRLIVRAGQTAEANFGEFTTTAKAEPAKAPATVVVKLPADAKLYVDGVLCPQTTPTRTFETPALNPGTTYTYTLKAEVVRNGKTKAESKRIEMVAGKEVSVDFGDMTVVQAVSR
jgi:uncharacterized protein (TIGR03000 family)